MKNQTVVVVVDDGFDRHGDRHHLLYHLLTSYCLFLFQRNDSSLMTGVAVLMNVVMVEEEEEEETMDTIVQFWVQF